MADHLTPHVELFIVEAGLKSSQLAGSNKKDTGVGMEEEGCGEVRLEWLTAMTALDTELVLNVPHS